METESSVSAIAAVRKPSARSRAIPRSGQSPGASPMYVHGTWNTVPMLTRTARRQNGSQQVGVARMASTPSAAAERKSAPTFVESATPSSTATRRAPAQTASTSGSCGRRIAQSTPRVSV